MLCFYLNKVQKVEPIKAECNACLSNFMPYPANKNTGKAQNTLPLPGVF
jgi:hypothetical protein